jgi:inhibitor of KinA
MMEITPLGDSALILRVREDFKDKPGQTLHNVLGLMEAVERAQIPGLIECASAYTTVAVIFDPAEVIRSGAAPGTVVDWLAEKIRAAAGKPGKGKRRKLESNIIEVPICFDAEFAFDLAHVAEHAGMAEERVLQLYCAAEYQVSCVGFTPGFPFLSGLPAELATPRRTTPRQKIPAGAVAIGGEQTGIYPLPSPGGWNIIGRTPLTLFDPLKNPPVLLRPGDGVRFRRITRVEFESGKAQQ